MPQTTQLVGVDIGASAIKVCQLSAQDGRRTVLKLGHEPLPRDTIVDGQVLDVAAVAQALGKIFVEQQIEPRRVAFSLSGQTTVSRMLSLPLLSDDELARRLADEVEADIPFNLTELVADRQVVARHAHTMEVLLVGALERDLEWVAEVAAQAGVVPVVLDVDSFAIPRGCQAAHGDLGQGTVVLVEAGAARTAIHILSGGVNRFSRDIASGGDQITEAIQTALGIDFATAELLKTGGSRDAVVEGILQSGSEQLAHELQRSVDFFLATSASEPAEKIVLCGGASQHPALAAALRLSSGLPVEPIDLSRGGLVAAAPIDPDRWALLASQFTKAIGLALLEDGEGRVSVNLLPSDRTRPRKRQARATPATPHLRSLQALGLMLDAGATLVGSLPILAATSADDETRATWQAIAQAVEAGSTFAAALEQSAGGFDDLTVALIRAGEVGGLLAPATARLVTLAETSRRLDRAVAALAPQPELAAAPLRQAHRFCSLLAALVPSGLPILDALELTGKQLEPAWASAVGDIRRQVAAGDSISSGMRATQAETAWPSLLIALVAAGEQAGRLGETMLDTATLCEAMITDLQG